MVSCTSITIFFTNTNFFFLVVECDQLFKDRIYQNLYSLDKDVEVNVNVMTIKKRIHFENLLKDLAVEINQCPEIENFIDFQIRLGDIEKVLFTTRNNSEVWLFMNNHKISIISSFAVFIFIVVVFLFIYCILQTYGYRYLYHYINMNRVPFSRSDFV